MCLQLYIIKPRPLSVFFWWRSLLNAMGAQMKHTAALLVLAAALGGVLGVCPNGYLEFQESTCSPAVCLRFAQEQKGTWYMWNTLCQLEGAVLAKLTGNLHHLVYQYIQQHPDMKDEAFWVGASDIMSEGNWVWTLDNSPVDMGTPHWDPLAPAQPDGGTSQNFMCLWTPRFYFASCQDTVEIYAICQF